MNKTCARCEKTVYPTEELKCLDKVWHKGCFKCQECGMTLNMRTYKGYGKLPYCESHVPKAKHTTMAETPELKRIAENTKIQSNVKYHADFERSKGKFTQVADDPETLRIKANTKIISNVAYHGDLEKKAIMERQRQINENGEIVDVPSTDNYHQQIESYATEMLPSSIPAPNLPPKNHYQTPNVQYHQTQQMSQHHANQQQLHQQQFNQHQVNQQMNQQINQHQLNNQNQHQHQSNAQHQSNNQPQHQSTNQPQHQHQSTNQPQHQPQQQLNNQPQQTQNRQYQEQQSRQYTEQYYRQQQQQTQPTRNDDSYNNYPKYDDYQNQYTYGQYQQPNYGVGSQQKIGRIQDYDPLSDGPRPPPNTQRATATLIYNSTNDAKRADACSFVPERWAEDKPQPPPGVYKPFGDGPRYCIGARQSQTQQTRQIGRVTDLDPLATEPPRPANHASTPAQRVYIAMYDYEANDSDEVSFREGDLISNVTSIDEGWMTGQVIRTGHTGMLPANYVEVAPAGSVPGYNW